MGGLFSPSRPLTWSVSRKSYDDTGRPFVDMIKDNPTYGPRMDEQIHYDIKVDCSGPHWRLLIRKSHASLLPYFSLEVTTSDMTTLVQGTHTLYSCGKEVKSVGIYYGTLQNICTLADEVYIEMREYDLLYSNCQHFCNKLLRKIHKRQFTTTIESILNEIFPDAPPSRTSSFAEARRQSSNVGSSTTAPLDVPDPHPEDITGMETETDIDSPLRKPDVEDLDHLVKKMLPLLPSWENIGKSLSLDSATLSAIAEGNNKVNKPCLREMLRNYLESDHASFEQLARVVQRYPGGRPIAKDILNRGRSTYKP